MGNESRIFKKWEMIKIVNNICFSAPSNFSIFSLQLEIVAVVVVAAGRLCSGFCFFSALCVCLLLVFMLVFCFFGLLQLVIVFFVF